MELSWSTLLANATQQQRAEEHKPQTDSKLNGKPVTSRELPGNASTSGSAAAHQSISQSLHTNTAHNRLNNRKIDYGTTQTTSEKPNARADSSERLPEGIIEIPETSSAVLDGRNRPEAVRNYGQDAFNVVRPNTVSHWGLYNGTDCYKIAGVNELHLIEDILRKAPADQKDFYFLDIGAGNFQWTASVANFINKLEGLRPDIHIHIIGVRGEQVKDAEGNIKDEVIQGDRCTQYNFGDFQIEEIESELANRGIPAHCIDLAVSRWTLRHLADPVGTFAQTYNVLRSGTGFFLGDGFWFAYEGDGSMGQSSCETGNRHMDQLLLDTKAPFITQKCPVGRSLDHFIIQRPNDTPCQLPMQYTSITKDAYLGKGLVIGSHCWVTFKRTPQETDSKPIHPDRHVEWCRDFFGNLDLHSTLKEAGALLKNDRCSPMHADV